MNPGVIMIMHTDGKDNSLQLEVNKLYLPVSI